MIRKWAFDTPVDLPVSEEFIAPPADVSIGFARLDGYTRVFDAPYFRVYVVLQTASNPADKARVEVIVGDIAFYHLHDAPVVPADVADDVASTTASGGTTTTIVKSGAGWTVNALIGKTATITAGTNSPSMRPVLSNTADTITIPTASAYGAACDGTTVFQVNESRMELFEEALLAEAMAILGYAGDLV